MTTYLDCGVDVDKNDRLVEEIRKIANIQTGFSAVHTIGSGPKLVQCTDGVGTKINLAAKHPELYDTIGQDLVAMVYNDLLCSAAIPAFFQDYIGMNNLDEEIVLRVIKSIKRACDKAKIKLTGGELAEMKGKYTSDLPELVGFATGFQYRDVITPQEGDHIIGLKSSGPHANGYSLINTIESHICGILEPTTLYTRVPLAPAKAHITGGGLRANVQRILPDGLEPHFDYGAWEVPKVFSDIQQAADVPAEDMWRTFNMGIGMCIVTSYTHILDGLSEYDAKVIGIVKKKGSP